MTGIKVLKEFFVDPPISMTELKALSSADRRELAELAAAELGVELDAPATRSS